MSLRQSLLPFALLATACGADMTETLSPNPPPVETLPDFETTSSAVTVREPVVAIASNGIMFRAAVSAEHKWPVFLLKDDRMLRFPVPEGVEISTDDSVHHLSLLASRDNQLHAAWSDYRGLYYARFDVLDAEAIPEGTAIQIAEASNARPVMAVGDNGMVTIAFASGFYSRAPTFRMTVTQGIISRGFSEPEAVNPACCHGENWTEIDGAWGVSVAALSLDLQGKVHIVYQWDGVLDYVTNKNGSWEHLARWDDSSIESPDASLALEPETLHLAYVARDNLSVKYVRYTRAPVVQTIPVPEGIAQMRMDLGKDKVAHFVIETQTNELMYATNLMEAPIYMVQKDSRIDLARLSRGNGGSLIGPDYGEHVVVYRRGGELYGAGAVEVAVRRQLP
jgi:hypothetical protein